MSLKISDSLNNVNSIEELLKLISHINLASSPQYTIDTEPAITELVTKAREFIDDTEIPTILNAFTSPVDRKNAEKAFRK